MSGRKLGERAWLTGLLLLAYTLISTGCASGPNAHPMLGPDLSGVVRIATRSAFAHVCPISATMGLTSGHVIDPRPYDPEAPLVGGFGQTETQYVGRIEPKQTSSARDLGIVAGSFPKWFEVADEEPNPGIPVYALGYDYSKGSKLLGTIRHTLTVLRIVGKTLVLDGDTRPGSSGGCVLDAQGRLVGIIEGWMESDNGERATLAVGVWGEDFAALEVATPEASPSPEASPEEPPVS